MTNRITISFSVPTALHVIIGCVLVATTIAAFLVHFELPMDSAYRGATVSAGVIAACGALAYWQWCTFQRARSEGLETAEVHAEHLGEIQDQDNLREQRIMAAVHVVSSKVTAQAQDVTDILGAIKELTDAVDALQECYLQEGQAPARKEIPAPREYM